VSGFTALIASGFRGIVLRIYFFKKFSEIVIIKILETNKFDNNYRPVVGIVTGSNGVTNGQLFFQVKAITRYKSNEFTLAKALSPLYKTDFENVTKLQYTEAEGTIPTRILQLQPCNIGFH
jgi:hypothetical protein